MFKINNLTKIYKSKEGVTVNALTNVSLDFGDKGLVFLLGKSGSGKSTLLNLLGGLDTPSDGEIIINRRSSSTFTSADFDNYRNTYVGIIFQEYNLIENYTAGDNIGLALELQGKKAERKQVDDSLRKVGLADAKGITLYNRRVNELSGGQKQRVAIARALIKEPEIILADEPTGALDRKTGESLYELFKELSKDKLIIVVTHDEENALKYGDRIIELSDGEVLADKTINHLDNNDNQEKDCNFVKSKLPFKRSFTLGASALKVKPMRLVATVLLSIIALSIFGFSMVAGSTNVYNAEISTMYENSQQMVGITNYDNHDEIVGYNDNVEPIRIFTDISLNEIGNYYDIASTNYLKVDDNFWFAELDPVTGEQDANLTPDSRFINKGLCRLPQYSYEVAITDYYADKFMRLGYQNNGAKVEIKTPDDLIGKKFGFLTICGVYSTEIDLDPYREYEGAFLQSDAYMENMLSGISTSMLSYRFICKGYNQGENSPLSGVLLKLKGDINGDMNLIKNISSTKRPLLHSAFSKSVSSLRTYDEYLIGPLTIVASVFVVFSVLLIFNLVSVSVSSKQQKLGVLRSLGATKIEILLICIVESIIIALTIFVFSSAILLSCCSIVNAFSSITLLNPGILHILLLLFLCVATVTIATIIPVALIVRKKPVDIIKKEY